VHPKVSAEGKAVRSVTRKRKKVSSLSVSSAEMHNSSLRTESMKEQTSRCGELARTVGRASCTESTEKYTSECSDAMSTGL
jgi:hypothetical protein